MRARKGHDVTLALIFDPKILRCLSFSFNLWMKYDVSKLKPIGVCVTTKYKLNMPVWHWPFQPQIYRCLPFIVFHLWMKYQVCRLKLLSYHITTKCGRMCQHDLDLWPFDPKSISVFLSLFYICVWSMKCPGWKLFEFLGYNKVWWQTDGQSDYYRAHQFCPN